MSQDELYLIRPELVLLICVVLYLVIKNVPLLRTYAHRFIHTTLEMPQVPENVLPPASNVVFLELLDSYVESYARTMRLKDPFLTKVIEMEYGTLEYKTAAQIRTRPPILEWLQKYSRLATINEPFYRNMVGQVEMLLLMSAVMLSPEQRKRYRLTRLNASRMLQRRMVDIERTFVSFETVIGDAIDRSLLSAVGAMADRASL